MLWLLLLQVLASSLWVGHSEVMTSFQHCPQFFYEGTSPSDALNPQNPAWICQCYNSSYHYATLYDRDRRIPVYSAYIYEPISERIHDLSWYLEPQLIGDNDLKDMETELVLVEYYNFTLDQIKASQAVLEDYNQLLGLERGYLNPSGHHDSRDSRKATFTLTNVVPQDSSLYIGQWKHYEFTRMPEKSKGCTTTYVITGAVPGNTYVAQGRINRPSHIWTAACCLVGTHPTKAWGAIAENDHDQIRTLSLGELEARLTEIYEWETVTLFSKACPRK
ncbi:endonuclease domain-containing 1 protein-like [Hirundo rustica]|uniref:endonuclease domain-containing 1 protein-like n=1 Tax=Hirundo rustica TaxID=43150 RepID=UPI001A9429B9|nr:endonuclease domain-containing 1 protein-like [Hirundo rustica]